MYSSALDGYIARFTSQHRAVNGSRGVAMGKGALCHKINFKEQLGS